MHVKKLIFYYFFPVLLLISSCNGDDDKSVQQQVSGVCSTKGKDFDANIFLQAGIHLYVIGDTGTGDSNQLTSANILDIYHQQFPLDAIIHTGDIFYPSGLKNSDDIAGMQKFHDIYGPLSLNELPWYIVAGNHDHDGSINALIDFSAQHSNMFYPSPYYAATIADTDSALQVNIIATDTTPMTFGVVQLEQLAWLSSKLNQQSNAINIVFGHHPIFSNGSHGDTDILKGNFLQQLIHYNVPLYLSGHEHNLEYIEQSQLPNMVISGAGGRELREVSCGKNSLYVEKKFGGFALYITQQSIWVIPVSESGVTVMFSL
ncbi:metallophosphoesterase [Thalassotalea fonticola]|uniref:Metallophosphoesterase n=1 Tax=Thalassotalea fonticola TaxID=3065649 RepID=A0ABZ0GMS2_9GAMM|nr:metallophosphoesterase [Colwelliaceae bacterium S1-1]